MGNIGIYLNDHTADRDTRTLPVDVFVHRHEIVKLIEKESISSAELIGLVDELKSENPESNIYMSVDAALIPALLRQENIKKLFLCSTDGCCSAENLLRMILLGCGEDYLPADVLDACPRAFGSECRGLPLEDLKQKVMVLYDQKRVAHALGCCAMAAELAKHYGADVELAARAGILHDITKIMTVPEQLRLCKKYAIMTDDYCGQMSKLLHAKTAAAVAEQVFGECSEVCESISWHTTGKADMTLLSKIIYIADYIEINRKFEGVEQLRELAFENLDAAVLCGVQMTIDTLEANNRPLNRYTVEARDFLIAEGRK